MGNFLKAITAGIIAYLSIFVALVIAPFLFLLFAWTGATHEIFSVDPVEHLAVLLYFVCR